MTASKEPIPTLPALPSADVAAEQRGSLIASLGGKLPARSRLTLPRLALPRLPAARGDRLRHLAESARLEERPDQLSLRLAIWGISLSVVAVLTWAGFAELPEVAHGVGQITPQSFEREIVHIEAGRVVALPVTNGQAVKAGDLIVQLDTQGLESQSRAILAQQQSLQLRIEALIAYQEGRPPDFTRIEASLSETMAARAAYAALASAEDDQVAILQEQVTRNIADREILERQISQQQANLAALRELLFRREKLFEQDLITYPSISAARQEVTDARASLEILTKQRARNQAAADELAERIESLKSSRRADAARDLQLARADSAQVAEQIAGLQLQIDARSLRAPLDGTVKLPERLALGDIIPAGEPLAYVVPEDDRLIARLRIPAEDIKDIFIGQKATLRISSFDFLQFGRLSGTISRIAPAALSSPSGEVFYTAEVALESNAMEMNGTTYPILPGMVVTADIINGSRTVLEYFLTPVYFALEEAFREG